MRDESQPPADGNDSALPGTKRGADGPSGSSKAGEAAHRAKRVRVSRACDQCRAGREKCNGGQPICQTCEAQRRPCTYNEQPKKRGIQPNYIRTLELTLAWLLQQHPNSEVKLSHLLPDPRDAAHLLISYKDSTNADAMHNVWRNGIICRQIDQILSGADIELPKYQPPNGDEVMPRRDEGIANSYQSPPLSALSDTNILPADVHQPIWAPGMIPQTRPESNIELLKLPEDSWNLLEHYFAFTQAWFPITERHDILKLMYAYPSEGLRKSEAVASEHAELWSIMAFAAARVGASEISVAYCREVTKALIPTETGFGLGHIKALLILGLDDIVKGVWITAWLAIGTAVRLLTYLTSKRGSATRLNEGRTKHTFLAAYLLESTISARTGASVHLRSGDVRETGLLIEDGLEEWAPWSDPTNGTASIAQKSPARTISTFNELVRTALRCESQQAATPSSQSSSTELDIVLKLLQNVSQHPRALLTSHRSISDQGPATGSFVGDYQTPAISGGGPIRHNSNQLDFAEALFEQPYPFMTIPNETAESIASSTPAQMAGATPNLWTTGESSKDPANMANHDIFEELAMLDRSDSTQNPSFMQNLGFGPDLDLAEFFGADYQPSDPLLAYMQPSSAFGEVPQGFEVNERGAG
ncbi:unnamed protein product [Zymoseptoria tritici ST99CH_3D7]|uniref:Zn(2)-C6 fungal-type domain-containing protein n=1 Tax=Zymoseptoria tritici (strain ST99CH_3D7) TaxID=1276538 RepID=A0A1X7RII6_ZYMT9|nr:unnamed protein product [Zymoseptoria tritici ST99CH_3D7]